MGELNINASQLGIRLSVTPVSLLIADTDPYHKEIPIGYSFRKKFPIGTYQLTAKKNGYQADNKRNLKIKLDEVTVVRFDLIPQLARLTIPGFPSEAEVYVNNTAVTLPHQLKHGTYPIKAVREGFHPIQQETTFAPGQALSLSLPRWKPLTGNLSVEVSPTGTKIIASPIKLLVDDNQYYQDISGIGPWRQKAIPVGTYRLTLEKTGYRSVTRSPLTIETGKHGHVSFQLEPKPGQIASPRLPEGTQVFINDLATNLPHELNHGIHHIRIVREGFKTIEMVKRLVPGGKVSLSPAWTALAGSLSLNVSPPDVKVEIIPVSVFVNDNQLHRKHAQVDSLLERELPIGSYKLTVAKNGYEKVIGSRFVIKTDETTTLNLVLTPKAAKLALPDLPSEALVYIDDKIITLPHQLKHGTHAVRITRKGFYPIIMPQSFAPGKTVTLPLEWKRQPSFVDALWRSAIVPGLGQYHAKKRKSGFFFMLAEFIVVVSLLGTHWEYSDAIEQYHNHNETYRKALSQHKIAETQDLVADSIDKIELLKDQRKTVLFSAVGIWAVNVVHAALIRPPEPSVASKPELMPTSTQRWKVTKNAGPSGLQFSLTKQFNWK